jgi:hypothetical protein
MKNHEIVLIRPNYKVVVDYPAAVETATELLEMPLETVIETWRHVG